MPTATPPVILLDIEGTTSSISFVHDVLFPFARKEAQSYLAGHWQAPQVQETGKLLLEEAGMGAVEPSPATCLAAIHSLMDRDAKVTGLKRIQGWIWKSGYESGVLKAHVYPDLVPALKRWRSRGCPIFIYSSGSIEAQKLFFGHTIEGNLLEFFQGHFDTTIGPKVESSSYLAIAQAVGIPPENILFFSDAPREVEAAKQAGLQVRLVKRPGNPPATVDHVEMVETFDEVETP